LILLILLILLFSFFSCNGETDDANDWKEATPLHGIYQNDFLLGNIISPGDLGTDRFILLKRHFNTVTAENHMKPENIVSRTQPWNYTFNNADNIVDTARVNGMKVVGHTLIWHSQTPSWLTKNNDGTPLGREIALHNLEKYVTDVVKHFEGKLISWDVVNEAMRESDSITAAQAENWRSCLRTDESGWYKAIGPEYIEAAFLAARAADPNAKLYYNDYNLNNANKARAVYKMVYEINDNNRVGGRLLIEGIGMQTHHHLTTKPETVKASIELFAQLGVEIAISEMDIQAAGNLPEGNVKWNEEAAQRQAVLYAKLFQIFLEKVDNKQVIKRVTFWGIDDGTSWRSSTHPTLLDSNYGLKPAFYAVMNPERYY
jgi:endo-1,4-beta-xylanase